MALAPSYLCRNRNGDSKKLRPLALKDRRRGRRLSPGALKELTISPKEHAWAYSCDGWRSAYAGKVWAEDCTAYLCWCVSCREGCSRANPKNPVVSCFCSGAAVGNKPRGGRDKGPG